MQSEVLSGGVQSNTICTACTVAMETRETCVENGDHDLLWAMDTTSGNLRQKKEKTCIKGWKEAGNKNENYLKKTQN